MKKKEEDVRNKMVVVRLNKNEYKKLFQFKNKSTEKSISNYLRKVALHEPVTVIYRNGSADEFLSEAIRLKKELNAIGSNFNQAVHKLHTLDRIPEFRTWIQRYESAHHQFIAKVDEIVNTSNRIYQLWLQG